MKFEPERLKGALRELLGKVIWGVVAGQGSGSHVNLYLGRRIPRLRPLSNEHLQAEVRMYDGEFCLFLQGARWELVHGCARICSSTSSNLAGGEMVEGLRRIRNLTVESISFLDQGGVEIDLSGQYKMLVFFSPAFEDVDEDLFAFFSSKEVFFVNSSGRLGVESK